MHFALLGDHPDGLDMARALVESGRHQLMAYSGSAVGADRLRRAGLEPRSFGDAEEILADPTIHAVIVAGKPSERPAQLRRALQSERHVLCVHPADDSPDVAYEAAMIQGDTRMVLVPLIGEGLHPGIRRLAELVRAKGALRLLDMERWSTDTVLLEGEDAALGQHPGVPGWQVLRLLGGEIVEIMGLAPTEEFTAAEPLLLAGRFVLGGMFQANYLPNQPAPRWRLTVRTAVDRLELNFPDGYPGPARLVWHDDTSKVCEEKWDSWNPWTALVEAFEHATSKRGASAATGSTAVTAVVHAFEQGAPPPPTAIVSPPRWQDEVRSLELDDAVRRSVERRRASTLDFQEATEEASFKGTMTLVGCALLWGSLLLLLLSVWLPVLGWLILPVFAVFLLMQLLRWVVPPKPVSEETSPAAAAPSQRDEGV